MPSNKPNHPFSLLKGVSTTPSKNSGKKNTSLAEQRLAQILDGSYQAETPPTETAVTEYDDFADYCKDIKPYQHTSNVLHKAVKTDKQTLLYNRARAVTEAPNSTEGISEYNVALRQISPESTLCYKHENIPNRVFEQLKNGSLRWNMSVDLHQCNIEQARQACLDLITQAQQDGNNVVKISHGKGVNAVLKTHVNLWLEQHSQVLAFHSCTARDGGNGAVLVLIKKATLTD